MPQFNVVIEASNYSRSAVLDLVFDLPASPEKDAIVRAVEAYAFSRGWDRVAVVAFAQETTDRIEANSRSAQQERLAKPLPSVPSIRSAKWRAGRQRRMSRQSS